MDDLLNKRNLHGVVLAGVHAWGNCVLEDILCRPLLPVASRPVIWHTLRWICQGGVSSASICGNSDTGILRRTLAQGESIGIELDYSEDVMPRGPAGCMRDAAIGKQTDAIIVVDGTLVPCIDLKDVLRTHFESDAAVTLVVDGAPSGDSATGEQQPLGIYVVARSVLETIPAKGYQDIKETLLPALHRRGARIVTHAVPASLAPRVTDAGSYLGVNMWAAERATLFGPAPEGYKPVGGGLAHFSAEIGPGAQLVGPVLVGPRTVIERDTLIVGPTSIGADCRIGPMAVISRSVTWDRCRVGKGTILDQCILTDDAQVEEDLVVRQSIYIPPRRRERKLFGRLASLCWPTGRRSPLVAGFEAPVHPVQS